MDFIKLFLAAFHNGFEDEIDKISSFVDDLNSVCKEKNICIQIIHNAGNTHIWSDYNEIINSHYFYEIAGNEYISKAATYFYIAKESRNKNSTLFIKGNFNIEESYRWFNDVKMIELFLIIELSRDYSFDVNIHDGCVYFENQEVLHIEELPFYRNNNSLTNIKKEYIHIKNDLDNEIKGYDGSIESMKKITILRSCLQTMEEQIQDMESGLYNILRMYVVQSNLESNHYFETGELDKAIHTLENKDRGLEENNLLIEYYHYCNEACEKIEELLKKNIELSLEKSVQVFDSYYKCTMFYVRQKRYEEAYELAKQLQSIENNGIVNELLGNICLELSDIKSAEFYYLNALKSKRKDSSDLEIAKCSCALGKLYFDTNQFEQAEQYYKDAYIIYKSSSSKNLAPVCVQLGNVYRRLGYYALSEKHYYMAYEKFFNLYNHDKKQYINDYASILYKLGSLYSEIHEQELSERYFLKAFEMYRILAKENPEQYEKDIAYVCENLGDINGIYGLYMLSIEYYIQALAIRKKNNEEQLELLKKLGIICCKCENMEKAELYYNEALSIVETSNGDYSEVVDICNEIAQFYYLYNQNEKAIF